MYGNPNRSRLVGQSSGYSLPNPPGRVSTELKAFFIIELLNRSNQTEVTLLDKVEEQHASADIFLSDGNNQTKVGLSKLSLGHSTVVD